METSALSALPYDSLTIRPARRDDGDAIATLLGFLGYPTDSATLRRTLHTVLNTPGLHVFLAFMGDAETVALISLLRFPTLRLNGFQVSIEELVVHPAYRGQGIGRQLIQYAMDCARVAGAVMLEVLTNNKRESLRRGFYEKNGFILSDHSVFRFELCEGRKTIE